MGVSSVVTQIHRTRNPISCIGLVVSENEKDITIKTLDSWTESLIGVIQPDDYLSRESYINYLEEKYR